MIVIDRRKEGISTPPQGEKSKLMVSDMKRRSQKKVIGLFEPS